MAADPARPGPIPGPNRPDSVPPRPTPPAYVGLLLLAVKAYVFFVTGLLFNVGVDILSELSLPIFRLADGSGWAGSMASDLTHGSGTLKDPVFYGQLG